MNEGTPEPAETRVGDLVAISRLPAVISLRELSALRARLGRGESAEELADLLGDYCLGGAEVRAAVDLLLRSLGRKEGRGDAFSLAGVYGSGKSHLLAALALLCGHPKEAWPAFLTKHSHYAPLAAGFGPSRLVVAIPLDAYPPHSHSLEHIVFSCLEEELARRYGLRVALTQDAYLLELVQAHFHPHYAADLDAAASAAGADSWEALHRDNPPAAAQAAVQCLARVGFPLDWRRSRAEAWNALRAALAQHGLDGPVLLLDELGLFLAGKDRAGLNADAAFLQYLAQLTTTERCWLVCVTQRGLAEAGDIDRRTLRQLRDRFRTGLVLDLAELGWVVEHKLVRPRDPESFPHRVARLHEGFRQACADLEFTADELRRCYPLNPLCLHLLQRAAEGPLSRTRSIIRLLQEAGLERGWLGLPASRLLTPDAAVELLQEEMAHSAEGRAVLRARDALLVLAEDLPAERREAAQAAVKTLALAALAGVRWPVHRLRRALVGGAQASLWQRPGLLGEVLASLYRRGGPLVRERRAEPEADEYALDLASTEGERLRQRLREVLASTSFGDARARTAALESCTDPAFPLAGLLEARVLPVEWQHARRYASVVCRDAAALTAEELQNAVGALASPHLREEGCLFIATPGDPAADAAAWSERTAGLTAGAAVGLRLWLPRQLRPEEQEHLVEHAALARMVADPTFLQRRDQDLRESLRRRWAESEAEVRALLPRAYYEGRVLGPGGEVVAEADRLWSWHGDWAGTLAALFAPAFAARFPRFPEIAPLRRLADRTHTNQIIDQFLRPGEVHLPPASTLEAHLSAYAAPLGLVEGEGGAFRLLPPRAELVQAALALVPARGDGDAVLPEQAVSLGDLTGRLAKSEWGVTREQSELLLAALVRLGYLVALDTFLQPVRFEQVAAPLSDFLPYLARGRPLEGPSAETARRLWKAATGGEAKTWDLPAQEQAWREVVAWAAEAGSRAEARRAALTRAAEALGHPPEAWASAQAFLARAQAVAATIEPTLTSHAGLSRALAGVDRLPGGVEASAEAVAQWRACETFLDHHLSDLAALSSLLSDPRLALAEDSMLAKEHRRVRARFAAPEHLLRDPQGLRAEAQRWLDSYRRHYLAWHERLHAPARFEELARLRRDPALEAAARLARLGLSEGEARSLPEELQAALSRRCLAGDPLPAGCVVCPQCGLALGQELPLPQAAALAARLQALLSAQLTALREHADLLSRRLESCSDPAVAAAVAALLKPPDPPAERLSALLGESTLAWLRRQLDQPRARPVRLSDLGARLGGKQLPKAEVRGAVEDWLGGGEEEVVEVVP